MPLLLSHNGPLGVLLKSRKETIRTFFLRPCDAIRPFDLLPTELLQEIFDRCFDRVQYYIYLEDIVRRGSATVRILSQVCRRWRSVTLAMPHLWAYVPLKNVDLVDLLLKRSGKSGLYICTIPGNDLGKSNSLILRSIQHASRWKAVELEIREPAWSSVAGSITAPLNPYLETVTINGMGLYSTLSCTNFISSLMSTSPRIRHLDWTFMSLPTQMDPTVWSRLTRIRLMNVQFVTADDCIQCLSMCTSALEIDLSSYNRDIVAPSLPHEVTLLLNLQKLTLLLHLDVGSLLERLSTPNLMELHINRTMGPYDYDAFTRFCTQSNLKLRVFETALSESMPLEDELVGHLTLPWLEFIPRVVLRSPQAEAYTTRLNILSRTEIPSRIRDKIEEDDLWIGWGLHNY